MKIAVLAGTFSTLSKTFVLNQVVGLIERGQDVEVFTGRPDKIATMHEDVRRGVGARLWLTVERCSGPASWRGMQETT